MSSIIDSQTPLEIRQAKKEDLRRLVFIEKAAYPDPWMEEDFESFLSLTSVACLVATIRESVVAFIMIEYKRHRRTNIDNVAVFPTAQRLGIGRKLIIAVLELAAREGQTRVTLEVRKSNQGAQSLYRSLGFTQTRIAKAYYEDGEDAVIMTRRLKASKAG